MKFYSLIFVLVVGLALAGCHRGLYSATAEIQLTPRVFFIGMIGHEDDEMKAAVAIMQSDDLLLPIIDQQKLAQTWARRFQSGHDAMPADQALDHLRKSFRIEPVSGSRFIKITALSEVPQEAAVIANQYKAMSEAEEAQRTQRGLDSLRGQITQEQSVLENAKHVVDIAKNDAQRETGQSVATKAQSLLDALNVRLQQITADSKLMESPVRIISRAVAPPE